MKFNTSKYLFLVMVWSSLGMLLTHCESIGEESSSSGSGNLAAAGKQHQTASSAEIEAVLTKLLEIQQAGSVSSEQKQQRLDALKNFLEALANDEEVNNGVGLDMDMDDQYESSPDSDEIYMAKDKRAAGRSSSQYQKKDATLRRQASRWDIGFGKRVPHNSKSKSFLDATYGKRNSLAGLRLPYNTRTYSYGRRQQWDLQYGRK